MTYFVGPGYPSDHFKFVKLDPVDIIQPASANENQEDLGLVTARSDNDHGRAMNENVPAESGGGQDPVKEEKSEINNSVLIANNNSDTSRSDEKSDREQTYLVYLKEEYEQMLRRDELKIKLENGDEETAPLFDTPTPKAKVLATISLARHHSTPWNITNKYTSCDDC